MMAEGMNHTYLLLQGILRADSNLLLNTLPRIYLFNEQDFRILSV